MEVGKLSSIHMLIISIIWPENGRQSAGGGPTLSQRTSQHQRRNGSHKWPASRALCFVIRINHDLCCGCPCGLLRAATFSLCERASNWRFEFLLVQSPCAPETRTTNSRFLDFCRCEPPNAGHYTKSHRERKKTVVVVGGGGGWPANFLPAKRLGREDPFASRANPTR